MQDFDKGPGPESTRRAILKGRPELAAPEQPAVIDGETLARLEAQRVDALRMLASAKRQVADIRGAKPRGVLPEKIDARPRGRVVIPGHEFRELQHRALMAEKREMPW